MPIEKRVIERRYVAGIRNLFDIYMPIVDVILIYDNSEGKHEIIAEKLDHSNLNIVHKQKYINLLKYNDDPRKN